MNLKICLCLYLGFLLMFKVFLILLIIPSISFSSVTFKNGERVGSYKGYGWPTIEKHELDAGKEWSQSVDNEFTRYGQSSHRFEFRALDCKGFDCGRGKYKGSFGRTEAYINTKETGENWYAWSFYIDDSELKYNTGTSNKTKSLLEELDLALNEDDQEVDEEVNNHLIQFGQMKLANENKVFPKCRENGSENVFIMQYKKRFKGLALSRTHCVKDKVVENYESIVVIPEKILFNQWHDVIIHAHWGNNGFFKLYINGDLKYLEEGFITNQYSYKGKSYGPSFRYGIYHNNAPKSFTGKITAWYDGIARAKKCNDEGFTQLLNQLGYSCESLKDIDNQIITPYFMEVSDW